MTAIISLSHFLKAAVWSLRKKVDLARKLDSAQLPGSSFSLSAWLQPGLRSPSHRGACCA